MDQAAEEIAPLDLWHDLHWVDVALLLRHSKPDPAVRSLRVVMAGVARENTAEMTATEDQGPVEDRDGSGPSYVNDLRNAHRWLSEAVERDEGRCPTLGDLQEEHGCTAAELVNECYWIRFTYSGKK